MWKWELGLICVLIESQFQVLLNRTWKWDVCCWLHRLCSLSWNNKSQDHANISVGLGNPGWMWAQLCGEELGLSRGPSRGNPSGDCVRKITSSAPFWVSFGWQLTCHLGNGESCSLSPVSLFLGQISTKSEFFVWAELTGRLKGLWFRCSFPSSAQQMFWSAHELHRSAAVLNSCKQSTESHGKLNECNFVERYWTWLLNEHHQNKTQPTRAAGCSSWGGHKWHLKDVTTCKLAPLIA